MCDVIIEVLLTLFLGLSRLMRSMPIPLNTYFIDDNKLSSTAGCKRIYKWLPSIQFDAHVWYFELLNYNMFSSWWSRSQRQMRVLTPPLPYPPSSTYSSSSGAHDSVALRHTRRLLRRWRTLKLKSSWRVKPSLWIIFICFTSVLLPLSPAPASETKTFYGVMN